jgi:hypothetical protein
LPASSFMDGACRDVTEESRGFYQPMGGK